MADAIPADDAERQEQLDVEGQAPAGDEPTDDATDDGQEPAAEAKTFSEDYVKRLRREGAAHRKKTTELEARLREFEDRDKTEVDKLTEALTAEKAARSTAELRLTRFEVAAEKGLELSVAEKFLVGETREEIEERADELATLLAQQKDGKARSGGFDGGARVAPPEEKTPEAAHNELILGAMGRTPPART